MEENEIEEFLSKTEPVCCIDATHPYATVVTDNILHACEKTGVRYMRVLRKEDTFCADGQDVFLKYFDSVDDVALYLRDTTGNIFITTGSKEIEKYTCIPDYDKRCVARVLPTREVVDKCGQLGFEGRNLICMQGPFSEELNYEMFRQYDAKWLVTKSTGVAGGYQSKCDAAIRAGANILVVGRTKENSVNAVSYEEAEFLLGAMLEKDYYDSFVGRCRE